MENKTNKIICPLCGSDTRLWGKKGSFNLHECVSCSLVFVNPLPNPLSVYNQDYFSGANGGFGYVDYDADKEPMVPTFNKYLDLLARYGKASGKIFDIGAATGFFLKIAKNRGYSVSGVEMSQYAASIASEAGIEVSSGDMMSMSIKPEEFDVVTMLDVLEHMTEPFKEISEVRRILKPGGLLLVNTPNGQSLLSKILKTRWHLVLPPEHLFYFSPKNLALFLEKNGFDVVYTGTLGKRFTIQYIFKMLYKWQKLSVWNYLSDFFSTGILSKIYIPINLRDNFLLIARKK